MAELFFWVSWYSYLVVFDYYKFQGTVCEIETLWYGNDIILQFVNFRKS